MLPKEEIKKIVRSEDFERLSEEEKHRIMMSLVVDLLMDIREILTKVEENQARN